MSKIAWFREYTNKEEILMSSLRKEIIFYLGVNNIENI